MSLRNRTQKALIAKAKNNVSITIIAFDMLDALYGILADLIIVYAGVLSCIFALAVCICVDI